MSSRTKQKNQVHSPSNKNSGNNHNRKDTEKTTEDSYQNRLVVEDIWNEEISKEELDKLLLNQNYDRFQFRLEHVLDLYDLSIEDGINKLGSFFQLNNWKEDASNNMTLNDLYNIFMIGKNNNLKPVQIFEFMRLFLFFINEFKTKNMEYNEAMNCFRKLLFYDFGFLNFLDEAPPPSQTSIKKLLQLQQQLEQEEQQTQQDTPPSPPQSKEKNSKESKSKEKGGGKMKEKEREKEREREREREEEERLTMLANIENTLIQEKRLAHEKEPFKNYPPPSIVYTNKSCKLFTPYEENIIIKFFKETIFQHFKLYKNVYWQIEPREECVIERDNLVIEVPGEIPPLSNAITLAEWENEVRLLEEQELEKQREIERKIAEERAIREANPFYPLTNDEIMEVVNETITSIMSSFVGIFENQVEEIRTKYLKIASDIIESSVTSLITTVTNQ
ncbi:hypothetical protein BCR36DRAFT_404131 [Piromyces finnis]|uniref:Uncharacterized protein n=1 Tax=Piromyces finnis TaxID=1754191 RepID=A0A1Y1VBY9_9FUNG|nr:hypothetical protein BCR36DRAFT_404131 [Piromyces finnis]|eukprot:ORX51461.1 hypothetical protein BCR36DRAFT_404131 [Piromyces finnis]